jgi:hypothetical protein
MVSSMQDRLAACRFSLRRRSETPTGWKPVPWNVVTIIWTRAFGTFGSSTPSIVPPFAEPDPALAVEANESRIRAEWNRVFGELLDLGIESRDVVAAEIGVPDAAGFLIEDEPVRAGFPWADAS